jgi:3-dehydroquinate synthase
MSGSLDQLAIHSRLGDYQVEFRDDAGWAAELSALENAYFVIDELVWQLHGGGCLAPLASRPLLLLPATEETKTLDGVATLCDGMIAQAAKRSAVVVSVGGGVVQDVTGFLASVIYRGVSWVYVPTTLLAQADSCIGAKTSLNFRHYKNLLGTMYPPQRVIVHPPLVATLNDDHYFSGLGEIVKMHIAAGPEAMESIERHMAALCHREQTAVSDAVRASLLIKKGFIEEDEFDRGRRRLLNFGHCFGHAIESATDFAVPHGQAVVLGMILAGLVSCARGLFERSRLDETVARLLVPTVTSAADIGDLAGAAVVEAMRHDKKRSGAGLAVVIPRDGWSLTLVTDVTEAEALRALEDLPGVLDAYGSPHQPELKPSSGMT